MKKIYKLLFFIYLTLHLSDLYGQAAGDYRSRLSGTWTTASNWETYNGTAWVTAGSAPTSANGVITIQSGHDMAIGANITLDQVVINVGGIISWNAGTLTIANGAGVDLLINGTLIDNSTSSISFTGGSTWQMGVNASLIRQRTNSSNNWQNAYEGGITNIPATANWIIRRMSTTNPSLTSVNAVYPNLIIENTFGGNWDATAVSSTFQGGNPAPIIKGNLDIGGTQGLGTVTFYDNRTGTASTSVLGNVIIRAGSTYNHNSNGLDIQGNLTVSGSFQFSSTLNTRALIFSGPNAQDISGTGTLIVRNLTINKSANHLTLSRAVNVDNLLTLTLGKIITSNTNLLTLIDIATASGGSDASFIDGPIRKEGMAAFNFPVGKGSNYQPLSMGVNLTAPPPPFWVENFGTGNCSNQGQLASSFVGVNGAWTMTNTGANGSHANTFFVSSTEAGMGAGNCGDGCLGNATLTNQTLHIGNVANSSTACFFCPTGDCGAAYDASNPGGFFVCTTNSAQSDKRAESPVINCTGRNNIQLSFNYMEEGEGVADNATLWYFDGAVWSQLVDLPKTLNCGGGQGRWTAYSITLPASANNNPNVRIGFRWVNNTNDVGTDPSFAVDDIELTVPPVSAFVCEFFPTNPQIAIGNLKEAGIDDISDREYWILDRVVGNSSRHVTISWDPNSGIVDDLVNIKVCRWDGAIWRNHFNGGTTGTTTPTPCNTGTVCGTITTGLLMTNFSPIALGRPVPLPIELIRFEAIAQGKKAQLDWVTATEENVSHFELERSNSGSDFERFAQVTAKGNSQTYTTYQAFDLHPLVGQNYYRIKTVDLDGQFQYSPIRTVFFEDLFAGVVVSPNPTRNNIVVQFPVIIEHASFELIDLTGREVLKHFSKSTNYTEFNLSELAAGVYFLRMQLDGAVKIVKVVKE